MIYYETIDEDLMHGIYYYMSSDKLNTIDPQYEIMLALGLEPIKLKPNVVRDETFLDTDPDFNKDIMGYKLIDIIPNIRDDYLREYLSEFCKKEHKISARDIIENILEKAYCN